MATIEEILGYNFYNNAVLDYLIAVAVFVAVILVAQFFKYQVVQFLKRLSKRTKSDFDDFLIDVIDGIGWPLYIILGLYAGVKFLEVPSLVHTAMHVLLVVIAAYYAIKSVQSIIDYGAGRVTKRKEKEGDKDTTVIDLFKKLLKVALWLAVFLVLLSSLGIDISGAVVGLGVTGIVLGFALQNILGDLFASFSLYFDKPFKKGDFIILNSDDLGTVEKIGIQTTRIKHLKGHELIVSNKELTSTRINNYKKLDKRRIVFSIGVTYQTPKKKMEKIPGMIRDIIDKVDLAEPDRVHFKQFGDFALIFEAVYYVATNDYNKYMDIQQEINLKIMERFEKEKIEFAYPTQTVFVSKG